VCAAIHPLALGTPFFRTVPLTEHGVKWIQLPACFAHPFDDGTTAILERSLERTGETLGVDATAYQDLMEPFVTEWQPLMGELLGPLRLPRHPLLLARFGLRGLRSAEGLAKSIFNGNRAPGVFAGRAAHSILPLDKAATASFGLVLAILAHTVGWPIPRGGPSGSSMRWPPTWGSTRSRDTRGNSLYTAKRRTVDLSLRPNQ
jgi:phytoene dehydrogenase-like protein